MAQHNQTGKWGEQAVVDHLTSEGYAIRERNWRMGKLEIDIIAEKEGYLAFVEVKTRSDRSISALLAIDRRKVNHMVSAANAYLNQCHTALKPRFDVAAVYGSEETHEIEYIADAFRPPLRTYR